MGPKPRNGLGGQEGHVPCVGASAIIDVGTGLCPPLFSYLGSTEAGGSQDGGAFSLDYYDAESML